METVEAFRRLARSSPWLWRTMRLTHDDGEGRPVRAWIRRPDSLRVETLNGAVLDARPGDPRPAGHAVFSVGIDGPLPESYTEADVVTDPSLSPTTESLRDAAEAALTEPDGGSDEVRWWTDPDAPRPARDADGLVIDPIGWQDSVTVDDAMWTNYRWVAMLNPRELADGVEGAPAVAVDQLSAGIRAGRPTLFATVRPLTGYDPRCGCCPLLPSLESQVADGVTNPRGPFADAHRVAVDLATGVCVAAHEVGGPRDGAGFEVHIEAVDEEYGDDLFTPTVESRLRGLFDPLGSLLPGRPPQTDREPSAD